MNRYLKPGQLTLEQLQRVYSQNSDEIDFPADWQSAVDRSRQTVLDVLSEDKAVYGVNTGFGLLANKRISKENLNQLQVNLVRSHAAGVGPLLEPAVVRLIMLMKAASLAQGYSGVRSEVISLILQMLNSDALPCIPSQGSVGASGDLAPLAHFVLAMIGEGDLIYRGRHCLSAECLAELTLTPIQLEAKEGLALLNGTQVSTALALAALFRTRTIFDAAIISGAMSVDAALGSDTPFDPRIHEIRRQPGQIECARRYRQLLEGSQIRDSHRSCHRVQDPYSLRCQPQVMGACLDLITAAESTLLNEANAVSDNPLVFSDDGSILSGGNFHAQPVAFAADQLAIAIAEIGSLAERRLALLIDAHLSELPPFLTMDGGLNSGFMIPQVTAASLVSENKHLASAVSIDSLPTSANQEDHVSMATYAARRLLAMCNNLERVIAIELLAASQGLDFRLPLKTSNSLQCIHQKIRATVPRLEQDRSFYAEIEAVGNLISRGEITSASSAK